MNGVLDPLPGRIHALRAWNLLRRPRIVLQQPAWDGALRAICVVARLAQGASHELRLAPRRAPKRPRQGNGAAWRAIWRLRVAVLIGSACGADIPQSLRRNRAGLDQRFPRREAMAYARDEARVR